MFVNMLCHCFVIWFLLVVCGFFVAHWQRIAWETLLAMHRTASSLRNMSQHHCTALFGVKVAERSCAVDNLDCLFRDLDPDPPSPHLTASLLFYRPLGQGNLDRLELILATERQRQMAWKFGHKKMMLMDGTFGVCSTCVLVFFLMVVDDRNVGVPVATVIFTPKEDAKAGHASYDGPLLRDLLKQWVNRMGTNDAGETFDLRVGMTDNDTWERFALTQIWPNSLLLLCMFHVWQAWRNGMNRYLNCIPKGEARQEVRGQLGQFLMRLLKDITDYPTALNAYNQQINIFRTLGTARNTALNRKKSKGGLAFLAYLKTYLNLESSWLSWSRAGILAAAKLLRTSADTIPRTTNHLESFNGRIKQKYFEAYQHSGRLPRLDVWVLLMVTRVLVDFFEEYDERRRVSDYYYAMRFAPPSPNHPPQGHPSQPRSLSQR